MAELKTGRVAFETARLKMARVQLTGERARSTSFRVVTQITNETLKVTRTSVWLFEDGQRLLQRKAVHAAAGDAEPGVASIDASAVPRYVEALQNRRALAIRDAAAHETTAELSTRYLAAWGVTSILDAPVIREGRVVGVVRNEHVGPPRLWTQNEIDFAGSSADIVALLLEQADRLELEAALKLQAEQRLEMQKLEALGLLARSVGHDMNSVLLACRLVSDEAAENTCPDCKRLSASLAEAVDVGTGLARRLLDVGERQSATSASTELCAGVQKLMPLLRALAGAGIEVSHRLLEEDVRVALATGGLERVLLNLVQNGRDAIVERASGRPPAGHIEVVVRLPVAEDDVGPNAVIIEVGDDGCGMDAQTRAHLFEPYFTTKEAGHGLGLATVYGIVKRAGGSIHVASERGHGSTFLLALPRDAAGRRRPR